MAPPPAVRIPPMNATRNPKREKNNKARDTMLGLTLANRPRPLPNSSSPSANQPKPEANRSASNSRTRPSNFSPLHVSPWPQQQPGSSLRRQPHRPLMLGSERYTIPSIVPRSRPATRRPLPSARRLTLFMSAPPRTRARTPSDPRLFPHPSHRPKTSAMMALLQSGAESPSPQRSTPSRRRVTCRRRQNETTPYLIRQETPS